MLTRKLIILIIDCINIMVAWCSSLHYCIWLSFVQEELALISVDFFRMLVMSFSHLFHLFQLVTFISYSYMKVRIIEDTEDALNFTVHVVIYGYYGLTAFYPLYN